MKSGRSRALSGSIPLTWSSLTIALLGAALARALVAAFAPLLAALARLLTALARLPLPRFAVGGGLLGPPHRRRLAGGLDRGRAVATGLLVLDRGDQLALPHPAGAGDAEVTGELLQLGQQHPCEASARALAR